MPEMDVAKKAAETIDRTISVLIQKTAHNNVAMAALYVLDGYGDHNRINETRIGEAMHHLSINSNPYYNALLAQEGIFLNNDERQIIGRICMIATGKSSIDYVGFDPFTHKCIGEYAVRMIK